MLGASWASADCLKCALPANERGCTLELAAVGIVQGKFHAHTMPLSIEKSLVLHCSVNSVCYVNTLLGQSMPTTDEFKE